jgi:hypothetical protein
MPRNGSGTYSLPAGNPVVTGTTISSTVQNNTTSDIATALTNSIAKDGQTTPTANLPLGGFKLTGLAAGSVAGDSLRYEQLIGVYLPLAGGTVTGATTFSAVATFSSDPIIPDEVYGSGWNASMEPPTKNAVYDKLEAVPAFGADKATNQSVVSADATIVVWGTELFDTHGYFASNRFTPLIAGYYQINASIRCQATNMTASFVQIHKNGSLYSPGTSQVGYTTSASVTHSGSTIVFLNGSTDYIEIIGSVTGTTPILQYSAVGANGFSGCLVKGT